MTQTSTGTCQTSTGTCQTSTGTCQLVINLNSEALIEYIVLYINVQNK